MYRCSSVVNLLLPTRYISNKLLYIVVFIASSLCKILQVVCQLTSHEMPSTLKAVQMYVNGKKYKYACEHKLTLKEQELCTQYLVDKRRYKLIIDQ